MKWIDPSNFQNRILDTKSGEQNKMCKMLPKHNPWIKLLGLKDYEKGEQYDALEYVNWLLTELKNTWTSEYSREVEYKADSNVNPIDQLFNLVLETKGKYVLLQ